MQFLFPQAFCLSSPTILSLLYNHCNITNKREYLSQIKRCLINTCIKQAHLYASASSFFMEFVGVVTLFTTPHADSGLEKYILKFLYKSEEFLVPQPNSLLTRPPMIGYPGVLMPDKIKFCPTNPLLWGTRWCSWLRHCATSRKVAGSIPDGVVGILH